MPVYKTFIRRANGRGRPTPHQTAEAALEAYSALCEQRTDSPATAILTVGNVIKKSYRLDRDWRGPRTTQDEQIAGETVCLTGRPPMEREKPVCMNLRLSPALHARLSASARDGGISLHQHILNALEGC